MKSFFKNLFSSSLNALIFTLIFAGTLGVVAYAQSQPEPLLAQLFDTLNISPHPTTQENLLGIGTTTPESPLMIESDTDAILTFNNNDDSWQYMQFKRSNERKAWMGLDNGNNFSIAKEGGGNIYLKDANVGIGTTEPEATLQVSGADTNKYDGTGDITLDVVVPAGTTTNVSGSATMFLRELKPGYTIYVESTLAGGNDLELGTVSSIIDSNHFVIEAASTITNVSNSPWKYSTNQIAEFKNSQGESVFSISEQGLTCTFTCPYHSCTSAGGSDKDAYCPTGTIQYGFQRDSNREACCCTPSIVCK